MSLSKELILLTVLVLGIGTKDAYAQDSLSVLYIPLIGITSIPNPATLPNGPGNVTYRYAVKNFIKEVPLTDIKVSDDVCDSVKFVTGDDNRDSRLDYDETWRYSCTTTISQTTESSATATGMANDITATHKANATVIVGSEDPAPQVSIVNATKVTYPLLLSAQGSEVIFTYKVNNPGVVSLSDITVTDDKCQNMSGKLGDTNGNNLLDPHEVWIYSCTINLKHTTISTVTVTAKANGLTATSSDSITINVNIPQPTTSPGLPEWKIVSGILAAFILFIILKQKSNIKKRK